MIRRSHLLENAVVHLLSVAILLSFPASANAQTSCLRFSETKAVLEQNLTDGDAEIVLFAKGQDEGLRRLVIRPPANGAKVLLTTPNAIGVREFLFESAEPPDLPAVLAAFPAGRYRFIGTTVSGECIRGGATLSHASAPGTTLLTPTQDQVVPADQVVLSWSAVPEAVRYVVELNNEDTDAEYALDIYPPTTSIAIPAALVAPGTEYMFGVATETVTGNIAAVELTFTTAP